MNRYSKRSLKELKTCRLELQDIFMTVLPMFDHSILDGARTVSEQKYNVNIGVSKTMNSKHVVDGIKFTESWAVDVAPYPVNFFDINTIYSYLKDVLNPSEIETINKIIKNVMRYGYFAGHVMAVANIKNIRLIWGGDWDDDKDLSDNPFNDLVHYELEE
jgi:hypothetical protein